MVLAGRRGTTGSARAVLAARLASKNARGELQLIRPNEPIAVVAVDRLDVGPRRARRRGCRRRRRPSSRRAPSGSWRERLLDVLAEIVARRAAVLVRDPVGEHARAVGRLPPEERCRRASLSCGPGRRKQYESMPLLAQDLREHRVVAERVDVHADRRGDRRTSAAGSAGRRAPGGRTTRPSGMLQSGSTHQPPTTASGPRRPARGCARTAPGRSPRPTSSSTIESQVKTKSGYSSIRSIADRNVARASW